MELFKSWKESLLCWAPSRSNQYWPVAKKALRDVFDMHDHIYALGIILLLFSFAIVPFFPSYTFSNMGSLKVHALIWFIVSCMQFWALLKARHSYEYKDWSYYKKNIKHVLVLLVLNVLPMLLVVAIPFGSADMSGLAQPDMTNVTTVEANGMMQDVVVEQNSITQPDITKVAALGIGFSALLFAIISILLSVINPFGALFFLDTIDALKLSHTPFSKIPRAILQAIEFIIYNLPFFAIGGLLFSLLDGLLSLLIVRYLFSMLGLAIYSTIALWFVYAIIALIKTAFSVALYNYRTKHAIDRSSHYYARHNFEG